MAFAESVDVVTQGFEALCDEGFGLLRVLVKAWRISPRLCAVVCVCGIRLHTFSSFFSFFFCICMKVFYWGCGGAAAVNFAVYFTIDDVPGRIATEVDVTFGLEEASGFDDGGS